MYKIYQVGTTDTLESVANKFNTTTDNIQKLNGIQDGMILRPGGYLIVPMVDSSNSNFKSYTVTKGDNMYSIAKNNNVDYQTLLQINGLEEDDYIYPNQEILIPNQKSYVTKEGDSINSISQKLGVPYNEIKANKGEIYLVPDQLLIYR